jgi:hypothetical protein
MLLGCRLQRPARQAGKLPIFIDRLGHPAQSSRVLEVREKRAKVSKRGYRKFAHRYFLASLARALAKATIEKERT